jgi:hypothetical protein
LINFDNDSAFEHQTVKLTQFVLSRKDELGRQKRKVTTVQGGRKRARNVLIEKQNKYYYSATLILITLTLCYLSSREPISRSSQFWEIAEIAIAVESRFCDLVVHSWYVLGMLFRRTLGKQRSRRVW